MRKKIKFSKNLEWLEPFLESVANLAPTNKISEIRGFKVPLGKTERLDGQIITKGSRFIITLRTHSQKFKTRSDGSQIATHHTQQSIYGILTTLAHEIAHLREWEHDSEHLILESTILKIFGKELRKYGIRDTSRSGKNTLFK